MSADGSRTCIIFFTTGHLLSTGSSMTRIKPSTLLRTGIILFGCGMFFMLVAKNTNIFTRVLSALPLAEIKNSEEWMGIYFGNKKIGYVHTTYANADGNQKVLEQSFLKLKILDQ